MYSYATLAELLQFNDAVGSNPLPATAESVLMDFAHRATQIIESSVWCDQWFMPLLDTRSRAVYPNDYVNTYYNTLKVDAPLCAITSAAIGDTTLTASDYRLFPYNETPVYEVQRKRSTGSWSSYASIDDLYSITGVWCYRRQYDSAWIDSADEVESNPLAIDATTLTVNDADGLDINGYTPRFSPGMLIRIESEYCIVTGVNTGTNVLTIARGARGTTAAQHVQNTQIDVFKVQPEIVEACALIATFNFNNKGTYKRVTMNTNAGTAEESIEVPERAADILKTFRKKIAIGF